MRVIATAGHVDHGKSTLIRALTGTDPDRLAEEKRRGLTIELGFAWTTIDGAGEVAFVDVPGHQKFISTTLAGLGPSPAVLFVVAADEGWRRQSAEHLAALDALGVEHGIVVITRCDLADPVPAAERALAELAGTSLRRCGWVGVSATTGSGIDVLRTAIGRLAESMPEPEPQQRQRFWIDRVFSMTGTGTVVTGTLGAGTISAGQTFELHGAEVAVKALESLGQPRSSVTGTARVAVALRGADRGAISRGDALLEPRRWRPTAVVDARVSDAAELPRELVLHVGTAAVPVSVRRLSETHLRLTLDAPLPLDVGDRALLRDPGRQRVAAGLSVVDADPPPFTRRGAAARRASELAARGDRLDPREEVARRPYVTVEGLATLGVVLDPAELPAGVVALDGHLLTEALRDELVARVAAGAGASTETLRARLGLPTPAALRELINGRGDISISADGRVIRGETSTIPEHLGDAAERLAKRWAADPLDAPTSEELRELGLDARALGILQGAGVALRLSDAVVVGPGAPAAALAILAGLESPFSVSEARAALGSSRRVTLPLLGYLDTRRLTLRGADDRRRVK